MPITAERILSHVEQTEYLKEVARREAARLLESADVQEFVDDPDRFTEALLAAILLALGPRAKELSEEARDYAEALGHGRIPDADLKKLTGTTDDDFLLLALPILLVATEPARAQVERMVTGASASTVATALESEATRKALLAPLTSAVKSAAATYMQGVSRSVTDLALEMFSDNGTDTLEWITVHDDAVCDDVFENSCKPRHGKVLTRDEWDEVGRPGAPQLICSIYAKGGGSNCRCELVPSLVPAGILNPIRVTDAIRAGKERAAALFERN
jgi:AcrR family transcriptional regulator